MDPSLKPDPLRKGSYYRRIEDVARGLASLQTSRLSETMRFFVYYFGCEKIARGLVGINARWPATKAYRHGQSFKLDDVKQAAAAFGLGISQQDLDWLFADAKEQHILQAAPPWTTSARHLRNTVVHDFGPSNIARIAKHAPFHNPRMERFLGCANGILEYQRLNFSEVA
jgi:hypothetical protein